MPNKTLIFGGTGGIGSAIARRLHIKGSQVHLVGRSPGKLKALAAELDATYTSGDVLDSNLFLRVAQEAGQTLDGLVYAVGTINLRSLGRLTETDFLNDYRVNALGAALAVQAALPALKKCSKTASIVLFSSVAVQQGFASHASISMAKGAVSGLTLALAAELAPKIRVNAIAPSLLRTPLSEKLVASEQMATAIANMHAIPRLGEAEDIAALAEFLLSSDSSWITGQILGVDGGRSTLRLKS